jgi:hypothetical protein
MTSTASGPPSWDQIERTCDGLITFFGIEEGEGDRQLALQRILAHPGLHSGVVYKGEHAPPYHVHVFLRHVDLDVCVGTAWREDRWPTIEEINAAFLAWCPTPTVQLQWSTRE